MREFDANTTKLAPGGKAAIIHPLKPSHSASSVERRPWTVKGIRTETVAQSRRAAQSQGMLLSLWVEKQLREAAERELNGGVGKSLAAEIMCAKVDSIESSLRKYIGEQESKIAELQKELRNLSNKIIPPLLKALTDERTKRRA